MNEKIKEFKSCLFKQGLFSQAWWLLASMLTIYVSYLFSKMNGMDTVSVVAHGLSLPGYVAGSYGFILYGILGYKPLHKEQK